MAIKRPGGIWWAALASVAVSAVMFNAQVTHPPRSAPQPSPVAAADVLTPPPAGPADAAPSVASAAEARMLTKNAPVAAQNFDFPIPRGVAPEEGLQLHTIWAARTISMMFLEIKTIGGFRQDALRWHPEGLAIDVMIPNYHSPEGIELGNQIAGFALANAKRWGVLHVIWRQGFYPGIGAPSWTADYGNETANHFDHVHIATDGGGYPTGRETYYLQSINPG
ncbi:MAG: glycoside hydrolase [Mycobacteriaceae bacterium]